MSPDLTAATIRSEHPWERARRLAFARWESEVRRASYGGSLPDGIGFVSALEPPLDWSDPGPSRRLFAFSALPDGLGATYLVAVPARPRPPVDGSLVRLIRPVKAVLPTAEAAYGELLLDTQRGIAPAGWEEILPGEPPGAATTVVPQLSELWHLPPLAVESLLLPLVGSIPWHGRPAHVDLHLEVEGWSLERHRGFLDGLLGLVPPWVASARRARSPSSRVLELASGARIRRPPIARGRPFGIHLRPITAPPSARPPDHSVPRTVITYGRALTSEFEAALGNGDLVVLLDAAEARHVPRTHLELPEALRATVWGLHWWTPVPPDAPEWYRWTRSEEPRLGEALDGMPGAPSGPAAGRWSALVGRREFRDRWAQVALARARLRGASAVEERDVAWTVDAVIQLARRATEWATMGRGPLVRRLDRTEGARAGRLRRAVAALFPEGSVGVTVDEARVALRSAGSVASAWEVENQLERLRIRGLLFQDRSGRYRKA